MLPHALQAQLDPNALAPDNEWGLVTGPRSAQLAFELFNGTHHGPRSGPVSGALVIGEVPCASEMIEHVRVRRRNRVPNRIEPRHPHGELGVEPADQFDDVSTGVFHECLIHVILDTNGNRDQRIIGIEHDGTLAEPTDTTCKGAFVPARRRLIRDPCRTVTR